jgi:hypothetical protein
MSRMIDLIRQSKVPPNIMRSAAKGALSVPPAEIMEILVYLASQPLFRDEARMTLAGWDENASAAVAADPNTPKEVLNYLAAPENLRPKLIPALVGNPSVGDEAVEVMATTASQEVAQLLLGVPRVRGSAPILNVLSSNSGLAEGELQEVQKLLAALGAPPAGPQSKHPAHGESPGSEEDTSQYEVEHAAEIAAEEGKPFQLVGGTSEASEMAELVPTAPEATTTAGAAAAKAAQPAVEVERVTTIQKIATLSVGQRVQLALKGNKDERFILIRDGVRVVCCAVLEAPKLSDSEAERFATMKNVSEHVLRGLAGKRKWMKNYNIVRNLAFNPRCPMDVTLQLLKHLMVGDLKHLSVNKDVADTIRKTAMKMWRQKTDTRGGGRSVD